MTTQYTSANTVNVTNSLPSSIPSDGIFNVNVVVPNSTSGFSATTGNPSTPYSNYIMNTSQVIGSPSSPYMPIALPAYIPSLYQNVYNINTNLQKDMTEVAVDNRSYPTTYAVQQYVQRQLNGTQLIDGDTLNNTYNILTTLTNTIVKEVTSKAMGFHYVLGNTDRQIAIYWMDIQQNSARNGSHKTVMFCPPSGTGGYLTNGNVAYLYAGDGENYFVVAGQQQKYYQFAFYGDNVQFIMIRNDDDDGWNWMVTDYESVFFTDTITFPGNVYSNNTGMQIPSGINVISQ